LPLYHLIRRRQQPLMDPQFHVPHPGRINGRLIAGATLFGVGWGLGGFCPAPAITAALTGTAGFYAFASMVVGVVLFEVCDLRVSWLSRRGAPTCTTLAALALPDRPRWRRFARDSGRR
jgi:uncharacterized membrane protein YedE/YeeE